MDRRKLLFVASAGLTLPTLFSTSAFAEAMAKDTAADYVSKTLMVGTLSKKMSEMAEQKATNSRIKEFAGFEVAEQTAVAEVLTDKLDPPPAPLPPMDKEMLEKLGNASGVGFERAYLRGQIEGHEKLLAIQEAQLKAGMSSDHGHIARLAKSVIVMHLTMLHDLEKVLAG